MSNEFKYSPGATAQGCLYKGGFQIGNSTADYGLSFYNGVTPGASGYTIYVNKAVQGPSIVSPQTDPELLYFANALSGQNFTTVPAGLNWFNTQTDKVCVNRDYEPITLNGLIFNFDVGYTPSYPRTGSIGYNVGGTALNCSLGGAYYSSNNGGILLAPGSFGWGNDIENVPIRDWWVKDPRTLQFWAKFNTIANSEYIFAWSDTEARSFGYSIQFGRLGFYFGISAPYYVTNPISANIWYHIVWTTDESENSLYLNGSFVESSVAFSNNIGWSDSFFGSPGSLSNVQLYTRALSASEILGNYNAMKSRFGL
jgi:hypothetical protein